MATTSIAPAATFLNVSLCKRSLGKNLHRKKGQRELELTAELRVSRGHPNETCVPFIFYPCLETEEEQDNRERDEGEDIPSGRMRNERKQTQETKKGIDRM